MKRGEVAVTVYFRIFEILLLVTVISIVASEVTNIKDSGVYQKKFLSRDIALVMDSFSNARGGLMYIYNPPLAALSRFDLDFSSGVVAVDDESWPYGKNNNVKLQSPPKTKFNYVVFKKTGNVLSVDQGSPATTLFNGFLLECPSATIRAQSIILDPGESYIAGEKESTGELKDSSGRQIPESEADLKIAVVLDSILNARQGQKVFGTRDLKLDVVGGVISQQIKSVSERVQLINANKDSILVSIHLGKQPKKQNLVKAFVNKDASAESYRLACSLLNSIADKYKTDITGTAIIPVDLAQLKPNDPKQVLAKDSIAVLLEIGNIDYPNNKLFESPVELAQMLALGIDLARAS